MAEPATSQPPTASSVPQSLAWPDLDLHPLPHALTDERGVVVALNGAARDLLGIADVRPGMTLARWVHDGILPAPDPDTGAVDRTIWLRTAATGLRRFRVWSRPVVANPALRLVTAWPVEDEGGRTVDDATVALEATNRQMRHLADNVPGALFQYVQHTDGSNRVMYMSPRCFDLWEVPAEAIEADASVLWAMVHAEDLPGMAASVAESARTLSPWYWEWRITTPSGIAKWLQGSGRPRRIDETTTAWDTFIFDVSERRRAEEGQRVLRARLRQSEQLEALGRLAGGVAHDVNNMLTVVVGCAEAARDTVPEDSPAADDLSEILSAAARSAGFTRQLLAFARQQPSESVVFDMADRIEDCSTMLERLVGGTVTVQYELAGDVPLVEFDPSQLDQVLGNLVLNARDAMPSGGTIVVGLRREGDEVVLTVADEGEGIPPTALPHIFEPFFTTKAEGKGTGLGLASVHGIVTGNGGRIEVSSTVGDGTTFTVRFPRSSRPVSSTVAGVASAASALPPVILVCDDEPPLRRMLCRMLERHGVRVLAASSPDEAMHLFATNAVDLLLTDVVTGGGGGVSLASVLRESHPTLPVVFITGYVSTDVARAALEAGPHTIVRKPFRTDELLAAIATTWSATA